MTPRAAAALVLLAALAAGGCATGASNPAPRASEPPRVRCLGDSGTDPRTPRPLFFFLCVESP